MLSPSSISDAVRDALQAQVKHASNLVNWATAIVAVGVALEGIELFHEAVSWAKRQARRGWATDRKPIPPDSIRILVGLYPPVTFVSSPGDKDFTEATAQFEQMRAAKMHEMDIGVLLSGEYECR